jgi:peptidoglycan/LPS O-acetylase OafA/YrhL
MRTPLHRSAARVALGVALILALPLVAMQFRDDVVWSLGDFVVAGVLLAVIGTVVELAVRAAGNLLLAAGIAILGILAVFAGGSDDAPGMVLLGLLLIASAVALGVRRVGRGPSARRQR